MRRVVTLLACVPLAGWTGAATGALAQPSGVAAEPPAYLAGAHSHNDYARTRPLLDALERGFASIEVDVVLRDGALYVAHAEGEVRPTATLRRLYLDPLRSLVRRNGGRIYAPSGPSLQLIIDVKTDAEGTYRVLRETLAQYGDILTSWAEGGVRAGPVTAVLSGNRALRAIRADTLRFLAVDGRFDDDRSDWSVEEMPLVSMDWEELAPARRGGRLAAARPRISLLHREGRKVRFWSTTDDEELWASLLEAGVDFIGTDDARRLARTLRGQ